MNNSRNGNRPSGKPGKTLIIHQLAAIILAGGKSRRFGAPKVLQYFNNRPFLTRIVDGLYTTGLENVLLVLGYKADTFRKKLPVTRPIEIITNPNYQEGQFSSLQAGIQSLGTETPGVVSCLIDQPHLLPFTYHVVTMNACAYPEQIIIPTYNGRGGHPVYLPRYLFRQILSAASTTTLRDVFDKNRSNIMRVEINDPGIPEDIDTRRDLSRIEELYAHEQ